MGDPNFEKPYDKELESQLANLKNEVKLLKETLDKKKTEIQEKEKECHGKDDIIQGNVEIIQGKEIIVQGKDKEIQGKDIIIKGLRGIIQRKDKEIQEKDSIIKGLEEIIQKYKEIKKIQEKNNIIQENEEINIDSVNHENDNVIHENGGVIQENDTKIQEFAREIQEKDKKIKDLELDNIKLRDEAAKYQCALGAATNFRLPDNDKNNSVIFADDIISLQNSLEEYITKCKGGIITEIDIPGVQNLLKKYGSPTIITIDPKTIIIKAVLKRHVIEKVFEYANGYFNNPNARDIEVIMFRKCRDMVNLAMDFAEQRDGVDETTKSFPIKLRQQLFATLGNRGFNNVINRNNQKFLHDFIRKNQYNLNKEINKYRKLNPEKKKEIKEIEDMAGDIIRKVVTLFWFRLRVQEPVADKFWFKNNEMIDPNTMEGKWEDNDIDNIVVDICYFPLIANNLTRQIYTPAKVLHMHKNNLTNVENSSESLSSK
ncbi:hypothetical protein RhiirC2_756756 [Rhizophagus irregularis]|uniref:Uncharacterized protein n=1 Tax=Rhizophagus irregularis TaxID=588596 RepID=A0A2N1MRY4_9GLOM|nr:hypothetical protein RhiirC2_756756 [Rhizophagus irregularis]